MRTYTITTGEATKLLATTITTPGPDDDVAEAATTRTVTTLRGLDAPAAGKLAADLTALGNDLAAHTADPEQFARQATRLGVRSAQLVTAERALTVSTLADIASPAGSGWAAQPHHPVAAIGRILHAADVLPEPARRAVRAELREILAMFDGPVVPLTVGTTDGPVTINAAEFVRDGGSEAIGALVCDSGRGRFIGSEDVVEFYSRRGRALENLTAELEAAEWEVYIDISSAAVVRRLAVTDPQLLANLVAEFDDADLDSYEEDTVELITLARELLASQG